MGIFSNPFGDSVPTSMKLVFLTVVLVAILLLIFWVIRKFAGSPKIKSARGRLPRLAVTDAAILDDKRRLVLIRRDEVEHLVMIGGPSDVLVESNIVRIKPIHAANPQANQNVRAAPAPQLAPQATGAISGTAAVGALGVANAAIHDIHPANAQAQNTPEQTQNLNPAIATPEPAAPPAADPPAIEAADLGLEQFEKPQPLAHEGTEQEIAVSPSQDSSMQDMETALIAPDENMMETPTISPADELNPDTLTNLEDALGIELSGAREIVNEPELAQAAAGTSPNQANQISDEGLFEENSTDVAATNSQKANKPRSEKPAMQDEMQKLLDELTGDKS